MMFGWQSGAWRTGESAPGPGILVALRTAIRVFWGLWWTGEVRLQDVDGLWPSLGAGAATVSELADSTGPERRAAIRKTKVSRFARPRDERVRELRRQRRED